MIFEAGGGTNLLTHPEEIIMRAIMISILALIFSAPHCKLAVIEPRRFWTVKRHGQT
jgi:hypothetical protein